MRPLSEFGMIYRDDLGESWLNYHSIFNFFRSLLLTSISTKTYIDMIFSGVGDLNVVKWSTLSLISGWNKIIFMEMVTFLHTYLIRQSSIVFTESLFVDIVLFVFVYVFFLLFSFVGSLWLPPSLDFLLGLSWDH